MIEYIEGDIFDSPAQVIVNTVNTVGVMGKGLALSFKKRYPDMFESYKRACEKRQLSIGKLMLHKEADHWILLFPTKENWRNPSKLEYIEKGLMKFVNIYAEKHITSIAFPKLGCGNGELDWTLVRPIMEKYLKPLPIDVYIYLGVSHNELPEHKEQQKTISWLKKNAKDMSFNGVVDDLRLLSAIIPYSFNYNGVLYNFTYNDGINIESDDVRVFVPENDFFAIWDEIRNLSIFRTSNNSDVQLVYALLFSLGYLSSIKIMDIKEHKMVSGYQINAGMGRMFAVKEID
ncbi:MAG: phosphatase [Ruminococcaceae bacterium]|nr:phosphatase [Oscillospiraceae bacterium]